jgi:hypothetical protein
VRCVSVRSFFQYSDIFLYLLYPQSEDSKEGEDYDDVLRRQELAELAESLYGSCCVHWDEGLQIRRLCGIYESADFHARPLRNNQLAGVASLRPHFRDHKPDDVAAPLAAFGRAWKPSATIDDKPAARAFRNWETLVVRWESEADRLFAEEEQVSKRKSAQSEKRLAAVAKAAASPPSNLFAVLGQEDDE